MELLYALVLTILIEGAVMFMLTKSKKWMYYNFLCNMLTNPMLNYVLLLIALYTANRELYNAVIAIGEILVLFGEAYLYKLMTKENYKHCFFRSLITNGASFVIGLLFF